MKLLLALLILAGCAPKPVPEFYPTREPFEWMGVANYEITLSEIENYAFRKCQSFYEITQVVKDGKKTYFYFRCAAKSDVVNI